MCPRVVTVPPPCGRGGVFANREEAGAALARLMAPHLEHGTILVAIPTGGIPVAAAIAVRLELALEALPVQRIVRSAGRGETYGAVAADGTVVLDGASMQRLALTEGELRRDSERAHGDAVRHRALYWGEGAPPDLAARTVAIVDDGMATGLTMRAAVSSLRRRGAGIVQIAIPSSHRNAVEGAGRIAEAVFCLDIRSGAALSIADAYRDGDGPSEQAAAALFAHCPYRRAGLTVTPPSAGSA